MHTTLNTTVLLQPIMTTEGIKAAHDSGQVSQ